MQRFRRPRQLLGGQLVIPVGVQELVEGVRHLVGGGLVGRERELERPKASVPVEVGELPGADLAVLVDIQLIEGQRLPFILEADRALQMKLQELIVGNALGLGLVELAVAVSIEVVEELLHVVVPRGGIRPAVVAHVQAQKHRPVAGQEDEIHAIVVRLRGGCRRRFRRGSLGRYGEDGGQARQGQQAAVPEGLHDSTSRIGLEPASAMRMGRPTLDIFCLVESTPTAVATVAKKFGTVTGLSLTVMPSGLVLP